MVYNLKFTEQEMHVINAALVELPFRVSAPVIRSINEQISSASHVEDPEDTIIQTGRKKT